MSRVARPILGPDVLASCIVREQGRAERARGRVAVLTVSGKSRGPGDPFAWPTVVDAVAAAARRTDLVGWLEHNRTLAVVPIDAFMKTPTSLAQLQSRIERRLDAGTMAGCELRVQELPPAGPMESPATGALLSDRGGAPAAAYDTLKRGIDVAGSAALLLAFAPVFAVIAIAVKTTTGGPVFFRQPRVGRTMKPFAMIKFSTMRPDTGHGLHQTFVTAFIDGKVPAASPGTKAPFKITNDPRVTPVGRVLRRLSADELPQLWNVLRGDMSLVGPRPPIPYEVERYQPWHRRRIFEAKPGMTGLWQVSGRSRTTFDEMVRLDLRYARTRSLWLDVKILLATPAAVILGKGAC